MMRGKDQRLQALADKLRRQYDGLIEQVITKGFLALPADEQKLLGERSPKSELTEAEAKAWAHMQSIIQGDDFRIYHAAINTAQAALTALEVLRVKGS